MVKSSKIEINKLVSNNESLSLKEDFWVVGVGIVGVGVVDGWLTLLEVDLSFVRNAARGNATRVQNTVKVPTNPSTIFFL